MQMHLVRLYISIILVPLENLFQRVRAESPNLLPLKREKCFLTARTEDELSPIS